MQLQDLPKDITGLSTQAQTLKSGELFFAIKGSQKDGHDFLEEALKRGAIACVVERKELAVNDKMIYVPSTRKALAECAAEFYKNPTQKFKLVGVTGTNGKTTTTFLLRNLWEKLGKKTGLIGTVENRILDEVFTTSLTTPGALELQGLFSQMAVKGVDYAAMEVTSIGIHQCRPWGSHFEQVVFTNLTQDHLDYHGDMETYFLEKQKLFKDYSSKTQVINIDDSYGSRLVGPNSIRYSVFTKGDFYPLHYELNSEGIQANIQTPVGVLEVKSQLIGLHNLYNLLALLGSSYGLELNLEEVLSYLPHLQAPPGRLEKVLMDSKKAPHVFVDYAHTDDALKNVLNSIHKIKKENQRLITVFGCGGERDALKRPKMAKVASELSDIIFLTSDNPRKENPDHILDDIEKGIDHPLYYREVDRRKAIQEALNISKADDIVLIAGKGHETYQIIGEEKLPFDDRLVVRDYYA